jgi:hypothetical protein
MKPWTDQEVEPFKLGSFFVWHELVLMSLIFRAEKEVDSRRIKCSIAWIRSNCEDG